MFKNKGTGSSDIRK